MMAPVIGFLPTMWETWIAFSTPSFSLCKPQLLWVFGGINQQIRASSLPGIQSLCPLSLSLSLLASQISK